MIAQPVVHTNVRTQGLQYGIGFRRGEPIPHLPFEGVTGGQQLRQVSETLRTCGIQGHECGVRPMEKHRGDVLNDTCVTQHSKVDTSGPDFTNGCQYAIYHMHTRGECPHGPPNVANSLLPLNVFFKRALRSKHSSYVSRTRPRMTCGAQCNGRCKERVRDRAARAAAQTSSVSTLLLFWCTICFMN